MSSSILNAKRRAMAKKQKPKPKPQGAALDQQTTSTVSSKPESPALQAQAQAQAQVQARARQQTQPVASRDSSNTRADVRMSEAEESQSNSDDYDDEPEMEEEDIEDYCKGGYHPVKIGDTFKSEQYKVVRKLGWGHFSTVWLAHDRENDIHVALKIVKSAARYTEAALDEIELCTRTVTSKEPHVGREHVAKMLDSFEHSGPNGRHVCMVFEVLGENLLSLLRNARRYGSLRDAVHAAKTDASLVGDGQGHNHGTPGDAEHNGRGNNAAGDKTKQRDGLPIPLVKQIARQIIAGLAYLHGPCNMIHTDLKPENLLVCIDNVEAVIRRELQNDSAAGDGGSTTGTQGQAALVQASRSVANSRAHSPASGAAVGRGVQATATNLAHSLERDLNDISLVGTPTRLECSTGSDSASASPVESPASARLQGLRVKIADLGNATWADHHFTEDIQTRQYRSPEVIIGARWDATADTWSCACVLFELLTGDYLFEPRSGNRYSKNEDHIAQIIETLGPFPKKFALSGKFSNELFTRRGELRNICRLHPFSLEDLLHDEYGFTTRDSREIAEFMTPMLEITPARRSSAENMLSHRWLQ
ncbi:serine/threonine protein kinase, CMGC [Coemansia thaxteri]|uniref:non-specific serine/threonine protein kinase n=1 Tax=Coemansia thaxteri TaxID=2663907 RepID=A0A9W8EFP9_9FUNG|nr:serine/threonine protein kinase, CMGC [Coemansia thaxteri]KAJ2488251.1 serine/threonine protein kinase, CMGC [Coemansia sp. RSA 2320]